MKADDKSITAGDPLPIFTYTVEGELSGETALAGTPVLSSPMANPNVVGTYPIKVNLTGVSYADNYTAADPASIDGTLTVSEPSSRRRSSSSGGKQNRRLDR